MNFIAWSVLLLIRIYLYFHFIEYKSDYSKVQKEKKNTKYLRMETTKTAEWIFNKSNQIFISDKSYKNHCKIFNQTPFIFHSS